MRLTLHHLIDLADGALIVSAFVVVVVPAARSAPWGDVYMVFWFVVQGAYTWRCWKAGDLSKSFREAARNPPTMPPLRQLATVLGLIAAFLVLYGG